MEDPLETLGTMWGLRMIPGFCLLAIVQGHFKKFLLGRVAVRESGHMTILPRPRTKFEALHVALC